jgi:hypothetical protein
VSSPFSSSWEFREVADRLLTVYACHRTMLTESYPHLVV